MAGQGSAPMHPMGNQSADAAPGGRAPTTYREAGVDVAAANAAVARIGRLARTTFGETAWRCRSGTSAVSIASGRRRSVPGRQRRRCRHQAQAGLRPRRRGARPRRRATWSTTASTTSWRCGAGRSSSSTTSPWGGSIRTRWRAWSAGMADACRANGLALIGGETAEMPGLYAEGEYDAAGFIVGEVAPDAVVDGCGDRGRRRPDRVAERRSAHQRLQPGPAHPGLDRRPRRSTATCWPGR